MHNCIYTLSSFDSKQACLNNVSVLQSSNRTAFKMDVLEDVVIVGGGIAGLATSLGLHRLGIRSLVLESAKNLRSNGFAFSMWRNAWRAADALGIGDTLRDKHTNLKGVVTTSANSGLITSKVPFGAMDSQDPNEVRCVNRKVLVETLESELPKGTIRYSSKVERIEIDGHLKSIHLADGTLIKTKVLIGSDGVNSVVAKFLGLSKPLFVDRAAVRGLLHYDAKHGFEPNFLQFFGKGIRYGIVPCDDESVYWFFTWSPSRQADKDLEDPTKLKQFILSNLGQVSDKVRGVFEKTDLKDMFFSPLRFRKPWELLWGNICSKDNICVIGDALHPMTPDLGQGACSALEDSVILSRLLGEAIKEGEEDEKEARRIQTRLEKFAKERRWRSFELISTAYLVGWIQQSNGVVMNFVRDKVVAKTLARTLFNKSKYDCGKLISS